MFSPQHLSRLYERLYVSGKSLFTPPTLRYLRTGLTSNRHRSMPIQTTQPAPWLQIPSRVASSQVSPRLLSTLVPPLSLVLASDVLLTLSLLPSYSRLSALWHANVPRPWDTVGVFAGGLPDASHGSVPVPVLQVREAAKAAEQVCTSLKIPFYAVTIQQGGAFQKRKAMYCIGRFYLTCICPARKHDL